MINQVEILENILSRLPAKSIGRFRCVSKPWKSLLSQPQFIKTHLNRTKQLEEQSIILVCDDSRSLYSAQLKSTDQVSNDEMTVFATYLNFDDHDFESETFLKNMASCDGLILIEDDDDKLLLINPTTREIKVVPTSPYAIDYVDDTIYGLGYDSLTDDYKVFTLSYYYDDSNEDDSNCSEMFVSIYSVKNGTWKRTQTCPYNHTFGHAIPKYFVDGHIHWLAEETSGGSSAIVAFNLEEEKFRLVPPPNSVVGKRFMLNYLMVLGGCLCMYPSSRNVETDIWMMEEYNVEESWTKFTISDPEKSELRPLCYLGKEQVVLVKYTGYDNLVMWNFEDGEFEDIVVEGIEEEMRVGVTFVESLVSPQAIYNNEAARGD